MALVFKIPMGQQRYYLCLTKNEMAIWIGQLITNDGILVYPIFRQIDIDPALGLEDYPKF